MTRRIGESLRKRPETELMMKAATHREHAVPSPLLGQLVEDINR